MKPEHTTIVQPNDDVHVSMNTLNDMLAVPGFDGTSIERARTTLATLAVGIDTQIGAAEAPDGIYHTVLRAQPRLEHAVADQVRGQHEVAAAIDDLLTDLTGPQAGGGANEIRARCRTLLARLARHRQADSDLLHQADETDIGGES